MTTDFDQLYVGGAWREPATTNRFTVHSPHDGHVVGTAPAASPGDIDAAVAAARDAFDNGSWSNLSVAERIAPVERLTALFTERMDAMAELITNENGSPITFSKLGQVGGPLMMLLSAPAQAAAVEWETPRPGTTSAGFIVRKEPVGVVGAITAWNVPQLLIVAKLVPALLMGCTVVVKPSPETPLDALLLAQMIDESGFPPGVVSIVPGGADAGAHLVGHPDVDKITFTGSTAVGRAIGARCGEDLRRVTLELGGKSAAIVLDDADIEKTVKGLRFSSFMNNGQACAAQTRILASRANYHDVLHALEASVSEMPVGDPMDEATEVGPLVSAKQWERVQGYIALGEQQGAKAIIGGAGKPDGLEAGHYVKPTVFAHVDNAMRIAQEEIFGPVVVVIPFDDVDDAVRIANDSSYGLGGSVWTADHDAGLDVARRIRTGSFGINNYGPDTASPFGGFKASGIGREWGDEGLADFIELKSIQG
ncbi:MAG: aldehyde dehydrogenase [Actinomycetota bacterium]